MVKVCGDVLVVVILEVWYETRAVKLSVLGHRLILFSICLVLFTAIDVGRMPKCVR